MKHLILVRKTNDLTYAMLTQEWKNATQRDLIIIADTYIKESLPFQNQFNNIFHVIPSKKGSIAARVIKEIIQIKRTLGKRQYDVVYLSNPYMTVNQFITKKCKKIYWIEDGLMNYYHYNPKTGLTKRILQSLIGINERNLINKIDNTYLWSPDLAISYHGKLKKFNNSANPLKNLISKEIIDTIKGKKIFVGQNLYARQYNRMTIDDYNKTVNKIIQDYQIDLYLPHPFSSTEEQIKCPHFLTGPIHLTLEMLATVTDFNIFSLNSSVLYTTKLINPNCNNHSIIPKFLKDRITIPEIIKQTCSVEELS